MALESSLPGERSLLRPALVVKLLDQSGLQVAQTRGLVDSGADRTTLPADWAHLLSIDLDTECQPSEATQVDGGKSLRHIYVGGLQIEVADEQLFLDVVHFAEKAPCVFLGRKDFFDRFLVLFDQRRLRFYLERQPRTPEEADDDDDPDLVLAQA